MAEQLHAGSGKLPLLDRWKQHFYYLSSDLNPYKVLKREYVDFIYNTFLEFWGIEHFYADVIVDIDSDKLHYILTNIAKPSRGSFYFLLETALLIDYARKSRPSQFKKLDSVKYISTHCRDIFFEIYIDWILSIHDIYYDVNVMVGLQEIEGYCSIENVRYLVECKMKYSVATDEIKIKKHMLALVIRTFKALTTGFECIGIIRIKEGMTVTQNTLAEIFKRLKNKFVTTSGAEQEFIIEADELVLKIGPLDTATLIELRNNLIPYDAYFTVVDRHVIDEEGLARFRVSVRFNQVIKRHLVAEKLLTSVKKARRQHSSNKTSMILFINNETTNDFHRPLIATDDAEFPELQSYLDNRTPDTIVVVLVRSFVGEAAKITSRIFCHTSLNYLKEKLQNLNFQPVDFTRLAD